jgi:hypothetical protein
VLRETQAVLLGPGLQDEAATKAFVQALLAALRRCRRGARCARDERRRRVPRFDGRCC